MADVSKSRRPPAKASRGDRVSRDPRIESTPPRQEETVTLSRRPPMPSGSIRPLRVALLEDEIAKLNQERANDADDIAAMLVRVADAQRLTEAAEQRAASLEAELEGARTKLLEAEAANGALEIAARASARRADAAEQDVAEAAATVERLEGALEKERARVLEHEAETLRRETGQREAFEALEKGHADALRSAQLEGGTALDAERRSAALRIEVARNEHTEAMRAAQAESIEALEAERRSAAQRLEVALSEHAEAMRVALVERAEAHEAQKRTAAAQLETVRSEHVEALRAAQAESLDALELLRREHKEEVAGLRAKQALDREQIAGKHLRELTASREERAAERRDALRSLENERAAAAQARQLAAVAEASLARARDALARLSEVVRELEEGAAAAALLQTKSLSEARAELSSLSSPPVEAPVAMSSEQTPAPPPVVVAPKTAEASLDDIEMDLPQ
jgi:hypothetical protein